MILNSTSAVGNNNALGTEIPLGLSAPLPQNKSMILKPRLLFTMGDVAGIGPEVLAKAWPELVSMCRPIVIGDKKWMNRVLDSAKIKAKVVEITRPEEVDGQIDCIPIFQGTKQRLDQVRVGHITAEAGRAAYDFLCAAIDWTKEGLADGIVTLPLHKEGLHQAGLHYPGHTEILAEKTGSRDFGMMLYARGPQVPHGLGVVHVTLHMALRNVFTHITTPAVLEKIRLLDGVMRKLCDHAPRLAVASLNPHASDGGLFGDEERTLLVPAVEQTRAEKIQVAGPIPSDTLFVRAQRGEFDGIVAMYHDQGHIPLKLLSGLQAVNITLGLPLVRTSVAHGTAYDIAGTGQADHRSLLEATRVAARLVERRF
jgi:4-hydroxythreonine-4-phosphate dehydrogenase